MSEAELEKYLKENLLPEDLRLSPFQIFSRWLNEATELAQQPNPNAMVISTLAEQTIKKADQATILDNEAVEETVMVPDARVVLCKDINLEKSYVVFFTNYQSAKGEQLSRHPFATAVFHWDQLGRQVRISGRISRSPAMESENYFNTRHPLSRLGAWASDQS
ncbi:MAG: hypothetical protein HKN88_09845, partial [Gammaproteobacteria bacterium]|nr:hypothetical protein [Gammaproteobacteria bacterium]NNM13746.1 hypothetical protein [Gammaproteobacteria bacterium]